MSVCAIDLEFASSGAAGIGRAGLERLRPHSGGALALDGRTAMISLLAGLYSVPMYALIQPRSEDPTATGGIRAANNIMKRALHDRQQHPAALIVKLQFRSRRSSWPSGIANAWGRVLLFIADAEYCCASSPSCCRAASTAQGERDEHIPTRRAAVLVCKPRELHPERPADGRQPAPIASSWTTASSRTPV